MAILPEVKCKVCDRRYSGIHSRCPYCGARRGARGKRADGDDYVKGKVMVGILILSALIVAVAALLFTTLPDDEGSEPPDSSINSPDTNMPDDNDVNTVPGVTSIPTPSPTPTPTPTPTPPVVESVQIVAYGQVKTDFTLKAGEIVKCKARTVPADTEFTPVWESSDESVFVVTQSGDVSWTGEGLATLTLTVGDIKATCVVRSRPTS
jgi:hypothetical protein